MDHYLSIDAFVRVAEVGSFVEVARQLNVSKSVITTRIQQLEECVGAPLFHRSTRSVRLSEVGATYYHECAQLVVRSNQIVDQMRQFRSSPTGSLRVHGIPGFVLGHLTDFLLRFHRQHPAIHFDFVVNDLVIDPIKEGFDCALQIFAPISEELIQKKLFPVRRLFCASPAYLDTHPPILHPTDLELHHLGVYSRYPTKDKWIFDNGSEQVKMDIKPIFRSNSVHFLKEIALSAGAVVCIPTIVAAQEFLAGRLLPVLPDYRLSIYWLSAVYPKTQRNSIKLRLFLDQLNQEFSGNPPWDVELVKLGYMTSMPDLVEQA